jgi:hypothetical protein
MAKRAAPPGIQVHANPPVIPLRVMRAARGGGLRELGPRVRLTLDEAAEVLKRPRAEVVRAIRAGFLRVCRRNGRRYVTVQACAAFLREERADWDVARTRRGAPTVPFEQVLRELGD